MGAGAQRSPPQRLGKYELLAPLAQGGTAEVYLARAVGVGGFEKVVVVKRLHDHLADDREFVDMFLDEARIGALLDHSNIVQTIDLGVVDEQHYIAMEYLAGMSLAQLGKKALQRLGGLPPELTLGLIAQAAAGLHYAHGRSLPDGTPLRLVHRDISPQNLIVTYEGILKVVDFGIAHATQEARDARTKAGFIKGKFAYMSPEQCLGQPFDCRTDVFALATVAHELLTGQRLFKRESTYKTYQAIVSGEVTVPSQVNPKLDAEIDAVVLKALAMNTDDRYESAEAFGEAIEALLHRRRRHVSAGDVARFLERHFTTEIADHQHLLGQLLAGQDTNLTSIVWHAAAAADSDDGIEELDVSALEEWSSSAALPLLARSTARSGSVLVPITASRRGATDVTKETSASGSGEVLSDAELLEGSISAVTPIQAEPIGRLDTDEDAKAGAAAPRRFLDPVTDVDGGLARPIPRSSEPPWIGPPPVAPEGAAAAPTVVPAPTASVLSPASPGPAAPPEAAVRSSASPGPPAPLAPPEASVRSSAPAPPAAPSPSRPPPSAAAARPAPGPPPPAAPIMPEHGPRVAAGRGVEHTAHSATVAVRPVVGRPLWIYVGAFVAAALMTLGLMLLIQKL
jgi:serine/threonine-protein kinase